MKTKTVCVIGAGVAGLSAVKSCLEEGLQPTCLEMRSDLGGMWNYNKAERMGRSRAYESVITNVSKEASCFSDFPYPENYPPYLSHAKLLEYLQSYAAHFDLERHILFNVVVEKLEQTEPNEKTGCRQWIVTTRNLSSDATKTQRFDCVAICTGVNSHPKMPNFNCLVDGAFKGRVLHSSEYDSPDEFQGKNVVVIGLGNSGADIAVDVCRHAKSTILSSRSGAWIIPRDFQDGLPADMTATSRLKTLVGAALPHFLGNWIASRLLNSRINHDTLGLKSRYGPMDSAASFVVNDELPAKILSGKVILRSNAKRVLENEIYFADESKAKVDVIICATGYLTKFPFISEAILPNDRSKLRLFEWMVPFEIPNPESLAVIGIRPEAGGSDLPAFECQTRYIAQIMSGVTKLPPVDEMKKQFEKMRGAFQGDGESFRFRIKPGFAYQDGVSRLGGFYPSFWRIFFRDPILAIATHTGPFMSYHYRLVGRHTWSGARERILNAISNTLSAIRSIQYEGQD